MPTPTASKSGKSIAHHDRSKSSGGSSRSSKLKKPPSRGLVCVDKSGDEQETSSIPNIASQEREPDAKSRRHQSDHVAERSSSSDSSDSLSSSSKYVVVHHEKHDDTQNEVKVENAHDEGATSSSPRSSVKVQGVIN